jgi:3',5'-cyclic-AMP phosphodiesterase
MRVLSIYELPIHEIGYLTAAPGGVGIVEKQLPFLLGEADFLPNNLEAIIITSDLQGIDPKNQQLLGYLVVEELEKLADTGTIPPLKNTGIILAGDLYAKRNKRGGVGDVREVWQAFNRQFRWVAGVAGNHDSFGNTQEEIQAFKRSKGIYYLDGNIIKNGELNIAGISGIISGKVTKPFRHNEKDFLRAIRELTKQSPDILVLHEGPDYPQEKLVGKESIRLELEKINSPNNPLIICGHSYWKVPMVVLENGIQVIKTDSRVIVLVANK